MTLMGRKSCMVLRLDQFSFLTDVKQLFCIWGKNYFCDICTDSFSSHDMVFRCCGHFLCKICYAHALESKNKCAFECEKCRVGVAHVEGDKLYSTLLKVPGFFGKKLTLNEPLPNTIVSL